MPGNHDNGEDQQSRYPCHGQQRPPVPAAENKTTCNQSRQRNGRNALGHDRQTETGPGNTIPKPSRLFWLRFVAQVPGAPGGGQKQAENPVDNRQSRQNRRDHTGEINPGGHDAGRPIKDSFSQPHNQQKGQKPRRRRHQTNRPLFLAEKCHTPCGEPIEKRGFFKVFHIIKPWCYEIATFQHFAGNFSVTPFIGIQQRITVKARKIQEHGRRQYADGKPSNAVFFTEKGLFPGAVNGLSQHLIRLFPIQCASGFLTRVVSNIFAIIAWTSCAVNCARQRLFSEPSQPFWLQG